MSTHSRLRSIPLLVLCLLCASVAHGGGGFVDGVGLGWNIGFPGETTSVPILVIDTSFTALGIDAGANRRIQGWSISVQLSDPSLVSAVGFSRAGATDGLTPLFDTTAVDSGGALYTWIVAYDETSNPVELTLDVGDLVGTVDLTLAPGAQVGQILDLTLEVSLTALANQGGSLTAIQAYGGLGLLNGYVRVEDTPIFADGFETGDTSQWTSTNP